MPWCDNCVPSRELPIKMDVLGFNGQMAAVRHGVASIDHQVQYHLLDLSRVSFNLAQRRFEFYPQIEVFANDARQHPTHAANDGVKVEHFWLEHLLATKGQ